MPYCNCEYISNITLAHWQTHFNTFTKMRCHAYVDPPLNDMYTEFMGAHRKVCRGAKNGDHQGTDGGGIWKVASWPSPVYGYGSVPRILF